MKKLVCGILSILLIANNILSLYAYEETSSSDFFADEIITDVLLEDDSLDENLDMDVEDFSDFNDELELEQEIEIPEMYSDTDFDTSDTISEFAFNPETNTIVAYSTNYAATKDIVIPAQINGYDVLHIGEYAFSARQLKSLTFEEGCKIETIGDYAFYNNFTLEGDVIFPETLTSIGIDAFRDTKIKVMYFAVDRDQINFTQNSLTSYRTIDGGYYSNGGVVEDSNSYGTGSNLGKIYGTVSVFSSLNMETAMVFPGLTYDYENAILIDENTNTLLQYYATHNENHTHVTIPEGVETIESFAFYKDTELLSVDFASTVNNVERYAFNLSALTLIDLSPTQLTSIKDYAFSEMTSVEIIHVPNTINDIAEYAFYKNTALEYVVGFESIEIKTISNGMFSNCSSLKEIIMPSTVTYVDDSAFNSCSLLESVVFSDNITYIGTSVFASCKSLVEITFPKELIELGSYTFNLCTGITTVNFNSKLEIINAFAFRYSTALTQIYDETYPFPTTIHTIGTGIFQNCTKLNVPISFPSLTSIGSATSNIGVFQDSGLTEISLPNNELLDIPAYAFRNCSYLESITIPESVDSIGYYAFYGCSKLTAINYIEDNGHVNYNENRLPYAMTIVPLNMFYGCYRLLDFYIHEGITSIESKAFYNCYGMDEIRVPSSVEDIYSDSFYGTKSDGKIYIDKIYDSIDGSSWGASTETWIIWQGMEVGALYDNDELSFELLLFVDEDNNACISNFKSYSTKLHITSYVQDLYDSNKLYKINEIADNAFRDAKITSAYIESGIDTIGDSAFRSCSSMVSFTIEDGIQTIGDYVFASCGALRTIIIGEGLEVIPSYAFYNCSVLTTLTLPTTINFVTGTAFYDATRYYFCYLEELTFYSEVEFDTSSKNALPENLKSLYLNAYTSDNPYEDLTNLGFNEKSCAIYYSDTIKYQYEDGDILFNINTNEYHKYIDNENAVSEVYLPSSFEVDGITYYPISINDYFLEDDQITVRYLHVPNEIKSIGDYGLYQSLDNGLERVYIDHEVDGIENSPWSRDYPLFRVIWSGANEANGFYYSVDGNDVSIYMYIGEHETVDLNDFNDWVNEKKANTISFYNFTPVDYNIVTLEEYLFYCDSTLQEITLSNSIETLEDYCFSNMSELVTINFAEGLLSIGDSVFRDTKSIVEIILPESLNTIGGYAFYECDGLIVLQLPREMDPTNAFGSYSISNCESLIELRLPDNLETIPTYFGMNLTSLEYMSIPYSVNTIGYSFARGTTYGLYDCVIEFLDRYESEPIQNESWKSYLYLTTSYSFKGAIVYKDRTYQDGFLYSYPQEKVLSYHYQLRYEDDIDIPIIFYGREDNLDLNEINYPKHLADNLLSISTYSMLKYSSVTIPDTIETIGASVFRGSNITEIKMPSKGNYIGTNAFRECKYLESIVLPANITTVYSSTFRGCTSLETVSFNEGITEIQYDAFYATGLIAVQLPNRRYSHKDGFFKRKQPSKFLGCSCYACLVLYLFL